MEKQNNTDIQEVNLLELIQVIVKRKMMIILICTIAIVVSATYALTVPSIYSATAKVLPPQKEGGGGGLSALLGQAGGLVGLAAGSVVGGSDVYVAILKSRSVADAVVHRLNLAKVYESPTLEDARFSLEKSVKVQAGKDGVISITADAMDPKLAALIANSFVDELSKMTIRLNLTKAGTERVFLEKRLDVVKKDLARAEEELKSFSQRHKIVQVDSQVKAVIEGVARLKADLASKEVQLAVLSSKQTENSPEVKATETAIRRLKAEIGALGSGASGSEGIPSVGDVPGVGLEYSRKLRDLKAQEAIFEQLMKQYEMVKLNEAKDTSSFQVLDDAVAPNGRRWPKRSQIVFLSTVAGFFFSLLVVFVQEYFSRLSDRDKEIIESIKSHALNLKFK